MNPPLAVMRYLAELDAALAARNTPDRDQIVTQISEHIAEALADRCGTATPSDSDIAAVLSKLGDPLRIAEDTSPDPVTNSGDDSRRARSSAPTVTITPPNPPALVRPWLPVTAVVLWFVGIAPVIIPLVLISATAAFGATGGIVLLMILVDLPFIASVVLVIASPLYRRGEKWIWTAAAPIVVVFLVLTSSVSSRSSVSILALVLGAVAVWAAVSVTIRAARRARSIQPPRATWRVGAAASGS